MDELKDLLKFCEEQKLHAEQEAKDSDLETNKSNTKILEGPKHELKEIDLPKLFTDNYLNGVYNGKTLVYSQLVRIINGIIGEN
jgi:hypothetical protein